MKYLTFFILSMAIASVFVHSASRQQEFIKGYVYDASDSTAIILANVDGSCIDAVGEFHTTTDSSGYYCVIDSTLPGGNWVVTASATGYNSQQRQVRLPNPFRNINFYLQPVD